MQRSLYSLQSQQVEAFAPFPEELTDTTRELRQREFINRHDISQGTQVHQQK